LSVAETISLIVGGWGAALATYLAIREARKGRRTVKVFAALGGFVDDEGQYRMTIVVRVINDG
jgi:hypothetical protein